MQINRTIVSLGVILMLHISALFTFSCSEPSCADSDEWYYGVSNINMSTYIISEGDTISRSSVLDTISYDKVIFEMAWNYSTLAEYFQGSQGVLSSSFADSGPKYVPLDRINIYSNMDFDDDHPAGTSLNDVFSINMDGQILSIDSFLSMIREDNGDELRRDLFFLTRGPLQPSRHRFIIEAEIDGIKQITADSSEITIR